MRNSEMRGMRKMGTKGRCWVRGISVSSEAPASLMSSDDLVEYHMLKLPSREGSFLASEMQRPLWCGFRAVLY
jgi:hypothetical protein